jgi:hypothetical protein
VRIRWFGETWGAPICDPSYQIDTPVNLMCMGCQSLIEKDHRGIATAFVGFGSERLLEFVFEIATGPSGAMIVDAVAYHADCFVYGLLGPEAPAPQRVNPSVSGTPDPAIGVTVERVVGSTDTTVELAEGEPDFTLPSIEEET